MSLPIVLPSNAQATLKNMLNSSDPNQILEMRKLQIYANNQGGHTGNAEEFFAGKFVKVFQFLNRLVEKIVTSFESANNELHKKLSEMNDNLVKMIGAFEDSEDDDSGSDFDADQKEEERIEREKKQISFLEKIAKSLGNSALEFLHPALLDKYGFDEKKSTFGTALGGSALGNLLSSGVGKVGTMITGSALGSMIIGGFQSLGKGLLTGARMGGSALLQGFLPATMIYGLLKETLTGSITGGASLTGGMGAMRWLGAGLAQVLSALTLGTVEAKTIYPYLANMTDSVWQTTKDIVSRLGEFLLVDVPKALMNQIIMPLVDGLDASLHATFGRDYEIIKKDAKEKLNYLKDGAKSIFKKVWSIVTGGIDWAYDKFVDFVGWIDSINAESISNAFLSTEKALKEITGSPADVAELGDKARAHPLNAQNLIKSAKTVAADMSSTGYCATGTQRAIQSSGLLSANESIIGAGHPEGMVKRLNLLGFEKIDIDENNLDAIATDKLPIGSIFALLPTQENDPYGHIATKISDYKEASDHIQNLSSTIKRGKSLGRKLYAFAPRRISKKAQGELMTEEMRSSVKNIDNMFSLFGSSKQDSDVNALSSSTKLNAQLGDDKVSQYTGKMIADSALSVLGITPPQAPINQAPIIINQNQNNIQTDDSTSMDNSHNRFLLLSSYYNLRRTP